MPLTDVILTREKRLSPKHKLNLIRAAFLSCQGVCCKPGPFPNAWHPPSPLVIPHFKNEKNQRTEVGVQRSEVGGWKRQPYPFNAFCWFVMKNAQIVNNAWCSRGFCLCYSCSRAHAKISQPSRLQLHYKTILVPEVQPWNEKKTKLPLMPAI